MSKYPLAFWVIACAVFVLTHSVSAQENHAFRSIVFPSLIGNIVAERAIDGLSQPVAIEFLPDGKALVLQRDRGLATLVDFSTGEKTEIQALPKMQVLEDAGVHDVELHPDYDKNGWIYISYSEGEPVYSTLVLDRFRLHGTQAVNRERLFTAEAYTEAIYHFAGRIKFVDGYVYLSIGDRKHPQMAQQLGNHAGSLIRLHDDGRVPLDNPFAGSSEIDGAQPLPEIWSYGHRNPEGLFVHPDTGELWLHEHGPRGGDELNLIRKGANYGWPIVSYGLEDDGGPVGMGITWKEGTLLPAWVYVPAIAPSDMVFYRGDAFPAWNNSILIGALAGLHLNRLVMRDNMIVAEERMAYGLMGRIRSVAVDDTGLVYLGSDDGEIWRLRPQ